MEFHYVLFWHVEVFKLIDFVSFNLLHQSFLSLPVLLEFLVFNLFLLDRLLFVFFLIDDLLFEFVCMLFKQLFSLFLQFLFNLFQLLLLANCTLKLSLFGLCLFFKPAFFFELLLDSGLLKLLGSFGSNFSLDSIFLSCSTFISLNRSLSS